MLPHFSIINFMLLFKLIRWYFLFVLCNINPDFYGDNQHGLVCFWSIYFLMLLFFIDFILFFHGVKNQINLFNFSSLNDFIFLSLYYIDAGIVLQIHVINNL